jgi:hypothetical protein
MYCLNNHISLVEGFHAETVHLSHSQVFLTVLTLYTDFFLHKIKKYSNVDRILTQFLHVFSLQCFYILFI